MSYAFRIRKSGGTLELVDTPEVLRQIAEHVPDGALFTINGHDPGPGTSSTGMIGITLVLESGSPLASFRGSATGQYNTVKES